MKDKKLYNQRYVVDFRGYYDMSEDRKEFAKIVRYLKRKKILKAFHGGNYMISPAQYFEAKTGIKCNCDPVIYTATHKMNQFFKGRLINILTVKPYMDANREDVIGLRVIYEEMKNANRK